MWRVPLLRLHWGIQVCGGYKASPGIPPERGWVLLASLFVLRGRRVEAATAARGTRTGVNLRRALHVGTHSTRRIVLRYNQVELSLKKLKDLTCTTRAYLVSLNSVPCALFICLCSHVLPYKSLQDSTRPQVLIIAKFHTPCNVVQKNRIFAGDWLGLRCHGLNQLK